MATIGIFTRSESGYAGSVRTLTVNAKVRFAPAAKEKDNAPDYRVLAGTAEIGAAWKKTSEAGRDYLSVKLDDPELPGRDLREPGRDRGRQGELLAHLGPPQRHLSPNGTGRAPPHGGARAV